MLIYVAGAYSAPTLNERIENTRRAADVARRIWKAGHAAICPHLNTFEFQHDVGDFKKSWGTFLPGDFEIIINCHAVVFLPGWTESRGACAEYAFAKWCGIKILDLDDDPEVLDRYLGNEILIERDAEESDDVERGRRIFEDFFRSEGPVADGFWTRDPMYEGPGEDEDDERW